MKVNQQGKKTELLRNLLDNITKKLPTPTEVAPTEELDPTDIASAGPDNPVEGFGGVYFSEQKKETPKIKEYLNPTGSATVAEKIITAKLERIRLMQSFGEGHAKVIRLDREIELLEAMEAPKPTESKP